ncbi:hypothetical protein BGW39_003887 [Mortierella sp. 14UC]|nr:hypothetical protein BGW39_003887 [Mortierella sp. 14UC]
MKFATAIAVLATFAVSSASAQFTNLTTSTSNPVKYDGANYAISPFPMCVGKPFCLTSTGTLLSPIVEGAKYSITGRYLGRLLYTDNHDLCSLLAASGTPCPVAAGAFNFNLCVPLKNNFPPNVGLMFQYLATNGNGDLLIGQKTTSNMLAVVCP